MAVHPVSSYDVFSRLAGEPLPGRAGFEALLRPRHLAAGEALFHAGETNRDVFVVTAGVVKLVYETRQGDAWVKGFIPPGLCFASLTALEDGGVTSCAAYAETASTVDQVSHDAVLALAERHLPWQRAIANAYRLYGQRKERREMELLTLSPQERYLGFVRDHPELVAVLKQRDIASYVRVTPVALSRIKARLR
jgi:CRP-like cAMP-binding protein